MIEHISSYTSSNTIPLAIIVRNSLSEPGIHSRILTVGDVILLADGGHGFEALEDLEIIEIKQGPFAGNCDKTRFDGILPESVIIHAE